MTFCYDDVEQQATISGIKFHDLNADGMRDEGEEGLEGWNITLWQGDSLVASTITGQDGDYIFTVYAAGTYVIKEVLMDGCRQRRKVATMKLK